MRDMACSRSLRVLLSMLLLCVSLPAGTLAQPATSGAPPGSSQAREAPLQDSLHVAPSAAERMLAESRELAMSGEYDQAVELLRNALAGGPYSPALLRDLHLQLIKTYVMLGNHFTLQEQGQEAAKLNYRAASELIAECLRIRALRNTRAEPTSEYPEKMVTLFAEARDRIFGGFRVVGLDPATAMVSLDGDTLALSADCVRGDDNITVGPHRVTVSAPRFKPQSETVTISPGATLERSYSLDRRHSRRWYVTRAAVVFGAVGAGVLIASNRHQSAPAPETPLGWPPDPPDRR
jgi:hypothetical protein